MGVEMAAASRVDLDGLDTCCPDPVGIIGRCLIALDHTDRYRSGENLHRLDEKCRLARARTGDQVHGEDTLFGKATPVDFREAIVLRQDALFDRNEMIVIEVGMI